MGFNQPQVRSNNNETMIRRFTHTPIVTEHQGISASIQANGRIVLTAVDAKSSTKDVVEYDEVTIPASLVFKLATLLRATRKIEYIPVGEIQPGDQVDTGKE